jgi:hypothetical protein
MHEREVSGQKHFFLFGISPLYRKEIFRVWGGGKNFAFKRRLFFFWKNSELCRKCFFSSWSSNARGGASQNGRILKPMPLNQRCRA